MAMQKRLSHACEVGEVLTPFPDLNTYIERKRRGLNVSRGSTGLGRTDRFRRGGRRPDRLWGGTDRSLGDSQVMGD